MKQNLIKCQIYRPWYSAFRERREPMDETDRRDFPRDISGSWKSEWRESEPQNPRTE